MRIRGPRGSRDVAAKDFFLDYLTTALDPDEILTEIRFPVSSGRSGSSFQELVRRKGDFAIVAAAASVTLDDRGAFADVRLALAGVAVTPILAGAARASLVGRSPTPEIIAEAAHEVAAQVQPESDFMASAEYRAAMAEVFARRALSEATQRAGVAP
jgi:CO/xanthine dehydrogenase FAD-binding subunit